MPLAECIRLIPKTEKSNASERANKGADQTMEETKEGKCRPGCMLIETEEWNLCRAYAE